MKILSILFTLLLISCGGGESNYDEDSAYYPNLKTTEIQMLKLVNNHRGSIGLKKLSPLNEAMFQSQNHSIFMAFSLGSLTHQGFSTRVSQIEEDSSLNIIRSGENVAYNSTTLRAHEALLNSYGHRKNIEGDFTHVGIGEETDSNGRMYFTQIFIKVID